MRYLSVIKTLHSYLNLLGIQIDCLTLWLLLIKHPTPHSFRAVSDIMDILKIPNDGYKITRTQLKELPIPSMLYLNQRKNPYYIFDGFEKNGSVKLKSSMRKKIIITQERLSIDWNGIVLIAEPLTNQSHLTILSYHIKQIIWFVTRHLMPLVLMMFLCLYCYQIFMANGDFVLGIAHYIGLTVSLLAIQKSISGTNALTNKICNSKGNDSCLYVLKSNGSKIYNWFSLGELSFSYFFTLCLCYWLLDKDHMIMMIPICNMLLCIPIVYSISWMIMHKTYCSICLTIDIILVIEQVLSLRLLFGDGYNPSLPIVTHSLSIFAICYTIILLTIKTVCWFVELSYKYYELADKRELFLSDSEMFNILLNKQQNIEQLPKDMFTINNGAKNAKHLITLIINPSCPFCQSAYNVISECTDCRIDILLLSRENDYQAEKFARHIVSIALMNNNDFCVTNMIIKEWYNTSNFHDIKEVEPAREILLEHKKYCLTNKINKTPTIIVDNRKMPEIYHIDDLKYVL